MTKGHTTSIFPTLYYQQQHTDLEDMNKELTRLIHEDAQKDAPITRTSLIGGYRSDRTFFSQENWAVQQLASIITQNVSEYQTQLLASETASTSPTLPKDIDLWGWSLLLREGDMVAPHLHKRCHIVGSYYIASSVEDDQEHAGSLVLSDPRIRAYATPIEGQKDTITLPHKVGNMVMFPGYLEHYVLPFKGEGERISVAFNIRLLYSDKLYPV